MTRVGAFIFARAPVAMSKEIPKEIPPELYEVYDHPVRWMRLPPQTARGSGDG